MLGRSCCFPGDTWGGLSGNISCRFSQHPETTDLINLIKKRNIPAPLFKCCWSLAVGPGAVGLSIPWNFCPCWGTGERLWWGAPPSESGSQMWRWQLPGVSGLVFLSVCPDGNSLSSNPKASSWKAVMCFTYLQCISSYLHSHFDSFSLQRSDLKAEKVVLEILLMAAVVLWLRAVVTWPLQISLGIFLSSFIFS